jgi:glyoxylase-like metal-dependent hydrolase (beta-lactamase superfamily II)
MEGQPRLLGQLRDLPRSPVLRRYQNQESNMCLCHGSHYSDHDLVPSRYATRVGEIDVMVLSDGAVPVPANILGTNVDSAVRDATLRGRFLPDVIDWGLNVVVVRSGGRTILIDAGVGSEMPDATRAGRLALRLTSAGIDPGSVTDVVATHIHMDHIGGLLDERLRSQMRPDLRVHVSQTDVDFFESPDFSHHTFGGLQDIIRSSARKFLDAYQSELRPFDKEYQVAPGVVVTRTGGHTPGHSVVRVASGGERLTFAGDAVVPVGVECPEWQNAFDHEPEESTRVRMRLLKEAAATGELFLASHLSFPSLGRVAVDGKAFRYVPANWGY